MDEKSPTGREHERLVKEMNLTLELLENLVKALPVTFARQDEICLYARQLMETAYNAGKAEKTSQEE